MVEFTSNDIVLMIGAISGGICAILKLSRCEQINICGFLAFKRRTNITNTTNITNDMTRTPSTDTIQLENTSVEV